MTSILKTDEIQSQNGGAVVKMQTLKHPSASGNNLVLGSDGNVSITNEITSGTFNGTIGDSITLSQGTWTPTFTNLNGTEHTDTSYGARLATYTRIGNLVFFNVDISLSAYTNTSTSQLYLSGLPMFGVSPGSTNISNNGHPGGIVSYFSGLQNFSVSYSIHWLLQNSGRISFYYSNGSQSSNFNQNTLTSSGRFILEGKYYLAEIT